MFKKIQTPDDLVALAKEFRKNRAILEERVRGELNEDKAQAAAARQMMLAKMEAERKLAGDKPVAAVDGKMSEVVPEKKKARAESAAAQEKHMKKMKKILDVLRAQRAALEKDVLRPRVTEADIEEAFKRAMKATADKPGPAPPDELTEPPKPIGEEIDKLMREIALQREHIRELQRVQAKVEEARKAKESAPKTIAKQIMKEALKGATDASQKKQAIKHLAERYGLSYTPTLDKKNVNEIERNIQDLLQFQITQEQARQLEQEQRGTGLKNPSRRAYTLDGDRFGSLVVDLPKLFATGRTVDGKRKFVAYKDGHKVLTISPVDDTLVALLTKRYDPKVAYTDAARDAFRQIVALSDLPVAKLSGKYKHVLVPQVGGMIAIGSVKDAIERLQILCGERAAGNDSVEVGNQISALLDYLLNAGEIDAAQHKKLFKMYV